jgi:alpha-ribazole phosphatase
MNEDATRWWWVRHAPVTGQEGRYVGHRDVAADVSDSGSLQRLAARLPPNAVWISSHLVRTRDTLAALAGFMDPAREPLVEPAFAEQHFGDWQGRSYDEVYAETGQQIWHDPASLTPPGGESFKALAARVAVAIETFTGRYPGADIIAVAHGGTIRAALALALGCTPDRALGVSVDNLSLTRLDAMPVDDGIRWSVGCVNRPA